MKKINKNGFTLVEIMIVVAIIGLLAAIGIPAIMGAYSNAETSAQHRNITDINKVKALLTLPVGDGGQGYTNGTVVDDEVIAKINDMLQIESREALRINGVTPDYGATINDTASYTKSTP